MPRRKRDSSGTGWSPDLMSQLSRAEASWRGVLGARGLSGSFLTSSHTLPSPPWSALCRPSAWVPCLYFFLLDFCSHKVHSVGITHFSPLCCSGSPVLIVTSWEPSYFFLLHHSVTEQDSVGPPQADPCPVPSALAPLWSTHLAVPDAVSFTTACCQGAGFTVLGQPTQLWFSSNKTSHLIFTVKLWGPYRWGLAGLWLCLCVICPQCILNWMKCGQLGDVLRNSSPLYVAASPWTPFTEDLLAFS